MLLLAGALLVFKAFAAQGHPGGAVPWLKLGPVGLMCLIGGIGLLFLPTNIKLK